jgi:hypothetical protein
MKQLKEYTYQHWPAGDQYMVRTGWGQDAGWTHTEDEAAAFCRQAREQMHYKAVIISENLALPFGTECEIVDIDRHWNSEVRLSYKGFIFPAGRGQWRFKVTLDGCNTSDYIGRYEN